MKTKLLLLALILSTSSLLYAGQGEHRKGKKHKRQLVSELNLTKEQEKSFESIMNNRRAKTKAAMESIQAETQAELAKILSPEQMKKLDEKKQQREHSKDHKKEHMKMRKHNQR